MTTWTKLHDNFWENPKVLAAGEDAALLYVQGLSYCSRNLTDGVIPTAALRNLTARKNAPVLARTLVREGLWVETGNAWQVHDYLNVQRSKAQVEAEREKARDRQRRARVTAPSRRDSGRTSSEVTGTVRVPDTETDTETESAAATDPTGRRALLEAAATIIGTRAAQRPGTNNPPALTRAVTAGIINQRHQDAYHHINNNPHITARTLADLLEPPPHPQDGMAKAQTAMAERHTRRINGTACPDCDDNGVIIGDDGMARRCACTGLKLVPQESA